MVHQASRAAEAQAWRTTETETETEERAVEWFLAGRFPFQAYPVAWTPERDPRAGLELPALPLPPLRREMAAVWGD